MAWPGLLIWTVALSLALPLALSARSIPLLALPPLAAVAGLGLWLAYLVLDTEQGLAWGAFGVALAAMGALALALAAPDTGPAAPRRSDVTTITQWFGAGVALAVFAIAGMVSVFAAIGQSGGF